MILWEKDGITVNEIAHKLILNTNTITPLLKRMEKQGILQRKRSAEDERKVIVDLTEEGQLLKEKAAAIPEKLFSELIAGQLKSEELVDLKETLYVIIRALSEQKS
jgi:DNA-binding MarR family transcriptional regulator